MYVARIVLDRGGIDEAISYLERAVEAYPGPEARMLLIAAKGLPMPLARSFSHGLARAGATYAKVLARAAGLLKSPRSEATNQQPPPTKSPRTLGPEELADFRLHQPSDIPELMVLRAATHGDRSIFTDQSYFDWIYSERSLSIGKPSELWLHRTGDRIDGHVGIVPVELKIERSRAEACWLFDLAVVPCTRGRGTAGALVSVACQRAAAAMALEVSGGGRQVLLRGGWSDLGELTLFVRPIDAQVLARRLTSRVPFVGALGNAVLSGVGDLGNAGAHLMHLVPEEVSSFDERVDAIWSEASGSYRVVVRRDSRLLNWRFTNFPDRRRYRLFCFMHAGKPAGYSVLRIGEHHGARAGYIVDFFCKPRWTYGILAHGIEQLRREKVAAVYCLHSNPVTTAPLLALGFIPRRSGWPFVADLQRLSPEVAQIARDPRNWFITAGDGDVDRPGETFSPLAGNVGRNSSPDGASAERSTSH
jgi:hypothetical protein